jgi:hypothetical protein
MSEGTTTRLGEHRATICEAIRGRRLLMFAYKDLVRVVEPHVYGLTSEGNELLNGWMRPGYSRTSPEGGWRNWRVDEISHLTLLPDGFDGPRPDYNPHDARMHEVVCSLAVLRTER